jgi:hypothetical protein
MLHCGSLWDKTKERRQIMTKENGKKIYVTDETLLGLINKGLSAEDIQKKTDLTLYTLKTRYSELQFNSDEMLKKPAGLFSSPNVTEFKKLGVNINRKKLMEFGFTLGDKFKIDNKAEVITLTKIK